MRRTPPSSATTSPRSSTTKPTPAAGCGPRATSRTASCGLFLSPSSSADFWGNLTENVSGADGGGAYLWEASLTAPAPGLRIVDNEAVQGGGLYAVDGATLENLIVESNTAVDGAGMYSSGDLGAAPGDPRRGLALGHWLALAARQSEWGRAREVISLSRTHDWPLTRAMAAVLIARGDEDPASLVAEAEACLRVVPVTILARHALMQLAWFYQEQGRFEDALELCDRAVALWVEGRWPHLTMLTRAARGEVLQELGRITPGACLEFAAECVREGGLDVAAIWYTTAGNLYRTAGELDASDDAFQRGIGMAYTIAREPPFLMLNLAANAFLRGDGPGMRGWLDQAWRRLVRNVEQEGSVLLAMEVCWSIVQDDPTVRTERFERFEQSRWRASGPLDGEVSRYLTIAADQAPEAWAARIRELLKTDP